MATVMKIADLRTDGLQSRLALSEADVKEYAEKMDEGIVFDPLVVFDDGKERYLADGFHRLEAMKRRGLTEVEVEVREGSRTEALRHSLGANAKHGRKLTPADNRHKLEIAWANRQELFGGRPSHELLAQTCAVSTKTVQRFMKRISTLDTVQGSEAVPLVSVDGKKRTVQPVSPTSTPDTVQGSETVTAEEPPAKQEETGRQYDPTTIFQLPENDTEREAHMAHIASKYGTFTDIRKMGALLKKDSRGAIVPRALSQKSHLWDFCQYNTVIQCLSFACLVIRNHYWADPKDKSGVFARFLNHEYRPICLIDCLTKACVDSTFSNVCRYCGGKGCDKCGNMGYETEGDIEAERKRQKEEEEKRKDENAKEMLDLLKRDPIPESFRQEMEAAQPVEPADVGLTEAEVQDDLPF